MSLSYILVSGQSAAMDSYVFHAKEVSVGGPRGDIESQVMELVR